MHLIRLVIVSLVLWSFIIFLGRIVILGVMKGEIQYLDTSHKAVRKLEPIKFWGLASLFSTFIIIAFYGWLKTIMG